MGDRERVRMAIVSDQTADRYAKAVFEAKVANEELFAAWHAVIAEQYSAEQGAPDAEEDCSDLG